ncbi:hypothetical protein [Jannaschia formosa]|uniref:hypothetical protein n=1 Tax=Jannaschia formosa TaxID=2259592 RepID=UPI000E1BE6D8|nr:hypothetical protein [Jannaschia formosa]TFL20243.1 hypothetical protein DR046_02570 [Jannaschia formosa]
MNAWDQDRRRSGGAGWVLDDSGEWVAASAKPELPADVSATAMPALPRRAGRGRGILRAVMTVFVIPAIAAAAVLSVWKGPGGEIALSRIEPLVASFRERRAEAPAPVDAAAPVTGVSVSPRPTARAPGPVPDEGLTGFTSHALPGRPDCASVRRGMADEIVFHRAGGCPD